jgi:hypothetical protein
VSRHSSIVQLAVLGLLLLGISPFTAPFSTCDLNASRNPWSHDGPLAKDDGSTKAALLSNVSSVGNELISSATPGSGGLSHIRWQATSLYVILRC